ncbi:hypothetical protein HER10_EVM0006429 [Colletotrichum scovillei]|uniref:uncharacterized protein n=1 Tax=Colletotrichum scovillei TaxID=1209932 RepID=UPI0015C3D908|nr:uncharacterized protein HER10_EVM0006429 [Colletotrichum scovillei]KAF4784285.1 hypothetical protein HER10_EVM0006429 [Colletotrichum scovillei]
MITILVYISQSRNLDWRKDTFCLNVPLNFPRSTSRCTYSIAAKAGTEFIEALPDTGAQVNIISARLAQKLRLEPQSQTERLIQLPTGGQVESPGRLEVPFTFGEEDKVTNLECFILPHSTHDLILSGPFLRATETLTKYRNRIVTDFRHKKSRRIGLRLLGSTRRCLQVLIDGQPVEALPDTGSDVMVMSYAYALSRGFNIDEDFQHFHVVELADGSESFTCGLVRGVEWTFVASRQRVKCDFYVLQDLCTDVVLSNDFLFGLDVFSKQSDSLSELSDSRDSSELLLISLKGKGQSKSPRHEDSANIDLTSKNAFSRQGVLAELNRRDNFDERIDAMDPGEQEVARRTELERRIIWEEGRHMHELHVILSLDCLDDCTLLVAASTQDADTAPSERRWWWPFRLHARMHDLLNLKARRRHGSRS